MQKFGSVKVSPVGHSLTDHHAWLEAKICRWNFLVGISAAFIWMALLWCRKSAQGLSQVGSIILTFSIPSYHQCQTWQGVLTFRVKQIQPWRMSVWCRIVVFSSIGGFLFFRFCSLTGEKTPARSFNNVVTTLGLCVAAWWISEQSQWNSSTVQC